MTINLGNIFELTNKQAYFFDLDGTIYLGNKLFKGVTQLIDILRKNEKKFFFLSNNSSKSTEDYLKKLHQLNIKKYFFWVPNLSKRNLRMKDLS